MHQDVWHPPLASAPILIYLNREIGEWMRKILSIDLWTPYINTKESDLRVIFKLFCSLNVSTLKPYRLICGHSPVVYSKILSQLTLPPKVFVLFLTFYICTCIDTHKYLYCLYKFWGAVCKSELPFSLLFL